MWLALSAFAGVPALAQTDDEDRVDRYLEDRGLLEPLAARLRERLARSPQEARVAVAERIGDIYVKLIGRARTPEARQELEIRSREVLRLVPEADLFEVRINLAKASYLQVEQVVERDRVRLASESDRAEAERVLRQVGPTFEDLAARLNRRVEQLEKKEVAARDPDVDLIRAQLSEARRLRSLARYYAGWSDYYTGVLTRTPQRAQQAMINFGALLNALPGRPATIDRMPTPLLKYEHVARAAIGCGLSASLLGNDVEAARWLEAVENADGIPPAVLDQLFARKLIVFAAAKRWADVDLAVRRRRQPERDGPLTPLSIADARLVAVLALDAARGTEGSAGYRAAIEKVAQTALGDLVSRGEIGHVLDLVTIYGTLPIGNEGFIVTYVRSLRTFDQARERHKASGVDANEPASDPAIINAYREAADLFKSACAGEDAAQFPIERSHAEIRRGFALFYAGDLDAAAQQYEQAASAAATPEQRRDALWYAIVSLDRAVERGKVSYIESRDRLATLYLKEFPATENAARLLLRQTRTESLSDDRALEILLALPKDSPVYEAARRQAARILYQAFRRAPTTARDSAAVRFADIAEEVLRLEQERAMAGLDAAAKEAAQSVVLRVRQLAEVLMGVSVPDVPRVEAALAVLDGVAAYHGLDLSGLDAELAYRQLQIAVARNDEAAITSRVDAIRAIGGTFADSADRLLYRRYLKQWRDNQSDLGAASRVVQHGLLVLDQLADGQDAAVVAARDAIADAAAALWRANQDTSMRDVAMRLDKQQLESGNRTPQSLKRLAELLEVVGSKSDALDAWRELLVGLPPRTPEWYEARYHSLRLLLEIAPAEAAVAMKQYKVLNPDFGPEPWGPRLAELDRKMPTLPENPPPTGDTGKK